MKIKKNIVAAFTLATVFLHVSPSRADNASGVYMEEMTWPEIKERMQQGATTAIVPTGGTEQNGPHMIVGKHNIIVHFTAGEIAKKLGNAMVAPVIAYVPEGRIDPPEGHMQFPGTMSVSDTTFAALLEDAAASLKAHGFKLICFIGDHGGSQDVQKAVAEKLTSEWQSSGVRVLQVSNYYAKNGQEEWTESMKIRVRDPGAHAGIIDTSELMALDAQGLRPDKFAVYTDSDYKTTGAMGDSTLASVEYGRRYLSLKVEAAVDQIHAASR